MSGKIAFQGEPGAYSHEACRGARPELEPMPCSTFEDAVEAVKSGAAELAILPVENSIYGRVADIHRLLPESGLHIVGEHFVPIHINLLAIGGTDISNIRTAMSHMVLLGQCREFIRTRGIKSIIWTDTAASAKHVAETGDPTLAALASELAAEIYGLDIIVPSIQDEQSNRTRFLVMS
ncbi:MAG: prephenate dehydratase, partial [Albidovulum sp.]|nr:prephenate dehydratase [Albidovulum sp.]